jgi:acetyl esterase/lipase
MSGRRNQYRFVGRRLADMGVLAVIADYRTYPAATFPGFVEDGARAVAWTHRHIRAEGGDPARIHLMGHSAGAQIAALLAIDNRYLEAVQLHPQQLAGVIGLSGPYDFTISGRYRAVFGPPGQWPAAQAVNFVNGDEPRFLLAHGDRDRVVAPSNSVSLEKNLVNQGVEAKTLVLPGAGHAATLAAFHDFGRQPALMAAIDEFLAGDP